MTVQGPHIVMIGGGTGSFTLLSKLKTYTNNLTAIVNMVDDGGSTGILRDELGALPPGDVRQCLVALSRSSDTIRDLFNYRFGEGSFSGHSFGNLFLSALEKTTGDFATAVKTAGRVLNVAGRVLPVTLQSVDLVYETPKGKKVVGQNAIDNQDFKGQKPKMALKPKAKLNPEAAEALASAELIVIAPGNLYSSLTPTLMVNGAGKAIADSPAKTVYVCNLVTKPGQTDGFCVHDFASEIERFAGLPILDYVLYNTRQPSQRLLDKYAKQGEISIAIDDEKLSKENYKSIGADLLSTDIVIQDPNDKLMQRTLIRHDGDKVARELMKLYFS